MHRTSNIQQLAVTYVIRPSCISILAPGCPFILVSPHGCVNRVLYWPPVSSLYLWHSFSGPCFGTTAKMNDNSLTTKVTETLRKSVDFHKSEAHEDGHWCAEVRDNATTDAEYIILRCAIGIPITDPEPWIFYLLNDQKPDGSWGIAPELGGDISTSVEAYFALKLLGLPATHPAMEKAREWILDHGGVARVRIFTRFHMAIFGLFPWSATPELPPEFIHIPASSPLSLYHMSSWSRPVMVSTLLLSHHRPVFALPNSGPDPNSPFLDEIWCDPSNKNVPYASSLWTSAWKLDLTGVMCTMADNALHAMNGMRNLPWRAAARRRCLQWLLERQEDDGTWAGIFPATYAGILALYLEGLGSMEPGSVFRRSVDALDVFVLSDEQGKRVQSCTSAGWDTSLSTVGLLDAGLPANDEHIKRSVSWMKARQDRGPSPPGDWHILNPHVRAGGFSFEYCNSRYPDIDDTTVAINAFVKQDARSINSDAVLDALQWILGMQNSDGGWGAFDHENNNRLWNSIPFSDIDAMIDPSEADVTGHVLETFGLLFQHNQNRNGKPLLSCDMQSAIKKSATKAIDFILHTQVPATGAWFGRWGTNYIYGTSGVLCGLCYVPLLDPSRVAATDKALQRAARWLVAKQNPDGGWGESLASYTVPSTAGEGASVPSQTGWALMGLLAALPVTDASIAAGVQYLVSNQPPDGAWKEDAYTGTGFPGHMYLQYGYYAQYFPMMALGRYASLSGLKVEY